MDLKELITIDKEILGGQPVFTGTRVPIETLFDHLEAGISPDEFLEDFPTVTKEQAVAISKIDKSLLATYYELSSKTNEKRLDSAIGNSQKELVLKKI